jgi:hypothetical protein
MRHFTTEGMYVDGNYTERNIPILQLVESSQTPGAALIMRRDASTLAGNVRSTQGITMSEGMACTFVMTNGDLANVHAAAIRTIEEVESRRPKDCPSGPIVAEICPRGSNTVHGHFPDGRCVPGWGLTHMVTVLPAMNIMAHMVEQHSMIEIARSADSVKIELARSADAAKIELARFAATQGMEATRVAANQTLEVERMAREERLELARIAHADKERETIERERVLIRQTLAENEEKLRETTEAFAEFKKAQGHNEVTRQQEVATPDMGKTGCTICGAIVLDLPCHTRNMHVLRKCSENHCAFHTYKLKAMKAHRQTHTLL